MIYAKNAQSDHLDNYLLYNISKQYMFYKSDSYSFAFAYMLILVLTLCNLRKFCPEQRISKITANQVVKEVTNENKFSNNFARNPYRAVLQRTSVQMPDALRNVSSRGQSPRRRLRAQAVSLTSADISTTSVWAPPAYCRKPP